MSVFAILNDCFLALGVLALGRKDPFDAGEVAAASPRTRVVVPEYIQAIPLPPRGPP
jgi:hypothetical protein